MKIVADKNIPLVARAFSPFGEVEVVDGRQINHETIKDAGVLLVRSITPVNAAVLEGSSVRFVATATIGTDHVDTAWLAQKGIGFASAPGSNAQSVAEYVIAALLHLQPRIEKSISDLTVGIVGVGNVGSLLERLCLGLGCRVLVCDPPRAERGERADLVDINTLAAESDVISLHVPLTADGPWATFEMANERFFSALKPRAVFINTSRGKVVHEPSLKGALNRLGALVLDVWCSEPQPDPELVRAANIATPHIAGYSMDGKLAGTQMIFDAACEFFGVPALFCAKQVLADAQQELNVQAEDDPLAAAALAAYDLIGDCSRMKRYLEIDESKRGAYFDSLRKEYPQRLEFEHFRVRALPNHRELLARAGFRVI